MDECVRARQSDVSALSAHARAMRGALATPRATRGARRDAATVGRRGRATRARAATRGDATTTTTTTTTTRRRALVALVALANARPANAGPATRPFVVDAVKNERWVAVDATFEVPATWANRPGQRARVDKYVLYTDTYGPNYRYTTTVPKLLGDGEAKIDQLALVVVSREGLESVGDLGTIEKIDPARAFGVEGFEGLAASEVAKASVREDAGKQTYYQWELFDGQHRFLMSACVSGGGLYCWVAQIDGARFDADAETYRAVLDSVNIPLVEESRNDMSSRIYETR